MAMIYCSECGGQISDKAQACPKCGNPIFPKKKGFWKDIIDKAEKEKKAKKKKELSKGEGCAAIIVFIVVFVVAIEMCGDSDESTEHIASKSGKQTAAKGDIVIDANSGKVSSPKKLTKAEKARRKQAFKREKIEKLKGPKPKNSSWDGSVSCIEYWLKNNMKDPDSYEAIEWSPVVDAGDNWAVRVKYRAKNSFGGFVIEQKMITFLNTNNNVLICPIVGVIDM